MRGNGNLYSVDVGLPGNLTPVRIVIDDTGKGRPYWPIGTYWQGSYRG